MPAWLRNILFTIILICSAVIGLRVYIDLTTDHDQMDALVAGPVSGANYPNKLPEFTLNDQWGEPQAITQWAGKPLLINFWATWCAPCRREMPLLEALHKSRNDIQVLGIAIDRAGDVQTFMAEAGITYPTLVGEQDAMSVSDKFGLEGLGLPFTVLVSGAGDILTVYIGEIDAADLDELADTAVELEEGWIDLATARSWLEDL